MYNDSFIVNNLSVSKSIISGKDYKLVENANCDLYENGNFLARMTGGKKGVYTASIKPSIDRTYTIKVSADGYPDVQGSTVLPGSAAVHHFERYDSAASTFRYYNYGGGSGTISGQVKYRIFITDNINTTDYYGLQALFTLYDSTGAVLASNLEGYVYNNSNNDVNNRDYGGTMIALDDANAVNGNQVPLDVSMTVNQGHPNTRSVGIVLNLFHLSPEFYKYRKTVSNQQTASTGLFAEPVIVYSNMSNGMGIFGGASGTKIEIDRVNVTRQW
jgi:hypothetical protein